VFEDTIFNKDVYNGKKSYKSDYLFISFPTAMEYYLHWKQSNFYRRVVRTWRRRWRENGWRVFWKRKVGAKVLTWEEWRMEGEAGRGGLVERRRWRVEMALEAEGRSEWNGGDGEWRWRQRLEEGSER